MSLTKQRILYASLFQLGWLLFTLGVAYPWFKWTAPLTVLPVIFLTGEHQHRLKAIGFILLVGSAGYIFDLLADHFSIIEINRSSAFGSSWLWFLWLWFVAFYPKMFDWLSGLAMPIQAILGAIGGLFSYIAATKLDCMVIHHLPIFILSYSAFWALVFPSIGLGYRWLSQSSSPTEASRNS